MPKNIKTILIWGIFAFIVYAIITSPERAADIVQATWEIIATGFGNIFTFFDELTK